MNRKILLLFLLLFMNSFNSTLTISDTYNDLSQKEKDAWWHEHLLEKGRELKDMEQELKDKRKKIAVIKKRLEAYKIVLEELEEKNEYQCWSVIKELEVPIMGQYLGLWGRIRKIKEELGLPLYAYDENFNPVEGYEEN